MKIPNGYASTQFTSAISQHDIAPDSEESTWANRFCGRYLTTSNTEYTGVSVCCKFLFCCIIITIGLNFVKLFWFKSYEVLFLQ